jgi:hypothetical protein
MRYNSRMDDFDRQVRRSAIKLLLLGISMGFLIGFVVGLTVAYQSIERTVVIQMGQGIKT